MSDYHLTSHTEKPSPITYCVWQAGHHIGPVTIQKCEKAPTFRLAKRRVKSSKKYTVLLEPNNTS